VCKREVKGASLCVREKREGWREGRREGRREGGREGRREGGKEGGYRHYLVLQIFYICEIF
jgi:flagellar biosynthesis/type III secretory pathway protein FliH